MGTDERDTREYMRGRQDDGPDVEAHRKRNADDNDSEPERTGTADDADVEAHFRPSN